MPWNVDNGSVTFTRKLDTGPTVEFVASEVRKEPTGVHAHITLQLNGVMLTFSTFNVGRDGDRTRIANKAHEKLGEDERNSWPKRLFQHEFDLFCSEIWTKWLSRIHIESLGADPVQGPVLYALKPWVLDEGGVICFAPPGSGKSWLCYLLAQSIHHGVTEFWPAEKRNVLVVNLERPAKSVRRRLAAVNAVLGLPFDATLPTLNVRGYSLIDIIPVIEREMGKVDVLFIDSLSRAGYGKLAADDVANLAMDAINRLAPSWFMIAHPPRADASHVFGSVMFEAAADLMLKVQAETRSDGTMGVSIEGDKANDIPKPKQVVYRMGFDEYGLSDFRQAQAGEFPELEASRKMSVADEVYGLLLEAQAMGATDIASELGRNRPRVNEILRKDARFSIIRKDGHKTLYGVAEGNT